VSGTASAGNNHLVSGGAGTFSELEEPLGGAVSRDDFGVVADA